MSAIGTGYDMSVSNFSPDGKLFQIEYAMKAVENSGTAIAIRCSDGVVFGVEKLVPSKLYEKSCNKRIFQIDTHIGMTVAGLLSDARHLAEVAVQEATDYRQDFNEPIPLENLVDRVSQFVHAFTLSSSVRPFGCVAMLSSFDVPTNRAQLFVIEPSGASYGYKGCAIGKGRSTGKTELEKFLKQPNLTCSAMLKEVAKIIYTVHDEVKDKAFELEMSYVGRESGGKHVLIKGSQHDDINNFAKAAMSADSSDEEAM